MDSWTVAALDGTASPGESAAGQMDFSYHIFGYRIRSNLRLPFLESSEAQQGAAAYCIQFGAAPAGMREDGADRWRLTYVSPFEEKPGKPTFQMWRHRDGQFLRIDYCDETQFWIDGGRIWATWPDSSSFENTVSYFLGPVIGFVLRMAGVVCLHASAVVCDGRALAFVGMPGAGKSTTAAALAQRGHAVLSDDIVAVREREGHFCAVPAYPYLALWPEAVEALYGTGRHFPPLSEDYEKRRLSLNARSFADKPTPLCAIFLLDERVADLDAPRIEQMTAQEELVSLIANTYANLLLDDDMRAQEFAFLGRLLDSVPVRRLRAHEEISRVGPLCKLIESEANSLQIPT